MSESRQDTLQRLFAEGEAVGFMPISGRYDGEKFATRDHRGRRWPITGCRCLPCLTTYIVGLP